MSFISTQLLPLAQQNFLQRMFSQGLIPHVKFLAAAELQEFAPGNGGTITNTVAGRKKPVLAALPPGKEPVPQPTEYEWFRTELRQFQDSDDVPMNQAYGTIGGVPAFYMQKMLELGIGCGTSLNLQARNALYKAYLGGNTNATAAGNVSSALHIASGNGFHEFIVNGNPISISSTNPKPITIGGTAASAIAWTPDDTTQPDGPGVLTLAATTSWAAGAPVKANDRSRIIRAGGATNVDQLNANSAATLALFRRAVAQLANDGVEKMPDGYWHVHCSPFVIQELANDNEYQRLFQGRPEAYLKDGSIGTVGDLKFFDNNQTPQPGTLNSPDPITVPTRNTLLAPHYWGELYNANGVQIERSIVIGRGAIKQFYVPEMAAFVSEAGHIGAQKATFSVEDNGILQMVMGPGTGQVRVVVRPPIDRGGQVVSITWSCTRGYPVFSTLLTGQSDGRFKKAMVIETGHDPIV